MADSVTQKKGDLTNVCNTCDCIKIDLKKPFVIAEAKDPKIVKVKTVKSDVPDDAPIDVGDDATFGKGGSVANSQPSMGADETTLKNKMDALLPMFAASDSDNNAKRMFDAFQKPNGDVTVYHDDKLDKEVESDANFKAFADRTLNAPICTWKSDKRRIHQALKEVGWDINSVKRIDDLGILALNVGDRQKRTGDWGNGLGLMVNGVQYVFVHVTSYHYDSCLHKYEIDLEFHLYDIFGIDAEDLKRFGSGGDYWYMQWNGDVSTATTGISAWWQLQHQHGYAPLLTKIVEKHHWTVPTD